MNQIIYFTPCGNFQGSGCGLVLVERAWEDDKSWPGMEKRGIRRGQGRWKSQEVKSRSLEQKKKNKRKEENFVVLREKMNATVVKKCTVFSLVVLVCFPGGGRLRLR